MAAHDSGSRSETRHSGEPCGDHGESEESHAAHPAAESSVEHVVVDLSTRIAARGIGGVDDVKGILDSFTKQKTQNQKVGSEACMTP